MSRHRLTATTFEPAAPGISRTGQVSTSLHCFAPSALRRRLTQASRTPALSVAMIAPLIIASAAGGEARPPRPIPSAVATADFTPVAVVSPAQDVSAPAVVAATRELLGWRAPLIAASAAVPASVVNPSTALGIPSTALAAYRNAEQKMAVSEPGCGIS